MIVNLTAHPINEVTTGVTIPPSGRVARVNTSRVKSGEFLGYPIFKTSFGTVEGLPEPEEGVMYIVSALCLSACPNRLDLLAPGNLIRDEHGNPSGCLGFRSNI